MSKTACLISLTPIAREARLLRQADALIRDGWSVVAFGHASDQPMPHGIRFIEAMAAVPELTLWDEVRYRAKRRLCRWNAAFAEDFYWNFLGNEAIFQHIAFVEQVECDLVVGHEFFSAPLAARLADHFGAPYSIDCHEFATEQYLHDPDWIKIWQPYVAALERRFLSPAPLVTTICESIAETLERAHSLPCRPMVVRSVPQFHSYPFRPTGDIIKVYYHGLVCALRGLETAISSIPMWRPEFHLTLRGIASDDYRESLLALAREKGVSNRLSIEPPIDFRDMVRYAIEGDIGLFVQEDVSLHKRYTLPNKVFEYIMAGLAICVSDLPELAKVVNDYEVGRLVSELTEQAVADTINGFTREDIDGYKKRSLEAAKTLCWEREAEPLMEAYEAIRKNHAT